MITLVFPSSLDASAAFADNAMRKNDTIIGASSIDNDAYKAHYTAWEKLPFIHEDNFVDALRNIIKRHRISSLFTPHAPTYHRLTELLPQFPGLNLLGESPYAIQTRRVTDAQRQGQQALEKIIALSRKPISLSAGFLAALFSEAVSLYGECSTEKMIGLCTALADTPKGDVIEVGTFFGKSAYVLNRLAAYFAIGSTIAVDPWDAELSVQHESPTTIQKLSTVWDWELVFQGFLLSMQARYITPFNYIREPSVKAWEQYKTAQTILTPEFGSIPVCGRIAVLHLDGNHDEKAVTEDFMVWSQHLIPGGWIIFDDYEWSQGSGPRKVVDKIKIEWKEKMSYFFVAGGAAFMKIGGE